MTETAPTTESERPAPLSGKAILALAVGVVGFASCGFVGVLAIPLGQSAANDIQQANGRRRGDQIAQAAIYAGWANLGLAVLFLLFAALYGLYHLVAG